MKHKLKDVLSYQSDNGRTYEIKPVILVKKQLDWGTKEISYYECVVCEVLSPSMCNRCMNLLLFSDEFLNGLEKIEKGHLTD